MVVTGVAELTVVVDIKTRRFSKTDTVYRLFPGISYKHFDAMRDGSVVFLDYPGMIFPKKYGYEEDTETLSQMLKASERSQYIYSRREDSQAALAEIEKKDYSKSRWSGARNLARGWLDALYVRARKGDLIVVPGPGWRRTKEGEEYVSTIIGEIVDDGPSRWKPQDDKYQRAALLVRKVRWLSEIDERDLERNAQRAMRTQNTIVQLPASAFEDVLGSAYRNVVLDDEVLARFVTRNAEFKSFEAFHFQAFVMTIASAMEKSSGDNPTRPGNFDQNIYEIASRIDRDSPYVPEQDASIHSPGYSTLKAFNRAPLVIAVCFALALSADAQSVINSNGIVNVELVNSESASFDPCAPDIGMNEEVRRTIETMGYDAWQALCPVAMKSHSHEGFEPLAEIISNSTEGGSH